MEKILIKNENDLKKYGKIIKHLFDAGGVIVFPSDTCYGLAANPLLSSAVTKVYEIKQRDIDKQISCIFGSIEQIKDWAELTKENEAILRKYLPGAYTFVLNPNSKYPLKGNTAGIRIPDNKVTATLSKILNSPYTSTSANVAGLPSTYNIDELMGQFKNNKVLPDLIIDAGELALNPPSTVVDLTQKIPKILRQGSANFSE